MTILREIVTKSEWIIAVLALYVVAWTRFNSPPTNRSGTTFALFFFGVIFYYALIVALWVLVMIGLVQGSIGFDWIGKALTKVNPEAQIQLAQYAPIVAALIIVVASQFRQSVADRFGGADVLRQVRGDSARSRSTRNRTRARRRFSTDGEASECKSPESFPRISVRRR